MYIRIIGGTHKGRRVFSVPRKKKSVKPVSSRIKQSVFDIIRPKITASYFLDLFAGVGAVSMEALSRGAKKAVMVEKDRACLKVIEKNIERLGFSDRAVALRADVLSGLEWLNHYSDYEGYDIVFMGPPYRDGENLPLEYSAKTLFLICEGKILAESGIVVCQHHKKEKFGIPSGLEAYKSSVYGDTIVDFLRIKRAKGK